MRASTTSPGSPPRDEGPEPRLRRRLVILALVVALVPATAMAAEIITGDGIVITEPVNGDLYLLGSDVIIDAPVDGDVIAAAGRVVIHSSVSGSVHALAGEVIIDGDVGGSVMAAGGTTIVKGHIGHAVRVAATELDIQRATIDGDLVVAATRITLDDQSTVHGEILMRVADAELAGSIEGGIRGSARNLRVSGVIGAASDIRVNSLRFMPGAVVSEPFAYTSDHEMLVDGGTSITGAVTRTPPDHRTPGETIARSLLFALFRFGWALATGWLLLRVMPDAVIGISETLRLAPARSLLWGLLTLFAAPIAAFVVAITVIGIPIALIMLACYVFALYASQIVVGMVIGMAIGRSRWKNDDGSPAYLRMLAAGLAIIVLVRSIPLDGWYPVASVATATIALGAIIIFYFRPRPASEPEGQVA